MTVNDEIATDTMEDDGGNLAVADPDFVEPVAEESEDEPLLAEPARKPGRAGRALRALALRWRIVVVVVLLVSSAASAAALYFTQYRVAHETGAVAVKGVVEAASTGTVALLSYAPETLDKDLATARALMVGDFLTYYGKFTSDVVAPAVRDKGIRASAQVVRAAMMEIHPESAKVLIFLNQETVSKERPDPALTASSVVVSLTKLDGKWLISAFDPV